LERIRREELKNAFESLCSVVPQLCKERVDTAKLPPQVSTAPYRFGWAGLHLHTISSSLFFFIIDFADS
jgi:hypothetical protein